jgi:hypothetical protein
MTGYFYERYGFGTFGKVTLKSPTSNSDKEINGIAYIILKYIFRLISQQTTIVVVFIYFMFLGIHVFKNIKNCLHTRSQSFSHIQATKLSIRYLLSETL